jgi:hypothetical protein
VASALLNASREVAGLFGITVIGAILRSQQSSALRHGTAPSGAFLDGYHAGLLVTVALIAGGAVLSYLALRQSRTPQAAAAVTPVPAELQSGSDRPDLAEAGRR